MTALAACFALALAGSALLAPTASAMTYEWGPSLVGEGQYTFIRAVNYTYEAVGFPRIRFNVDNPHSVNIRTIRCGGDYHNAEPITIPAHDQTYHYVGQAYSFGNCIEFYARSLFGIQTLSGYILS